MTEALEQARHDLVTASHILATERVLDAFGHVSLRHPEDPELFLLPVARSPGLVGPADVIELDLDGAPVVPDDRRIFIERALHAEIYRRRPDIGAVVHFHSPDVMPFCLTGRSLRPVTHVGATLGRRVPIWSAQEALGDTDLLVATREQGASLAAALGDAAAVLLANHGAVATGAEVREMTFRAIHLCTDARLQIEAAAFGPLTPLTDAEIDAAGAANLAPRILARAWEWWSSRI